MTDRRQFFRSVTTAGAVTIMPGGLFAQPALANSGLYAEVQRWYFDIAHAAFPWPMAAVRAFMPSEHILFGTGVTS